MKKYHAVFFLGLWVAVLPFLGFPRSWKEIIFAVTGLLLAYVGYVMYREQKIASMNLRAHMPFEEHNPHTEPSHANEERVHEEAPRRRIVRVRRKRIVSDVEPRQFTSQEMPSMDMNDINQSVSEDAPYASREN